MFVPPVADLVMRLHVSYEGDVPGDKNKKVEIGQRWVREQSPGAGLFSPPLPLGLWLRGAPRKHNRPGPSSEQLQISDPGRKMQEWWEDSERTQGGYWHCGSHSVGHQHSGSYIMCPLVQRSVLVTVSTAVMKTP